MAPQVTSYIITKVQQALPGNSQTKLMKYDGLVEYLIGLLETGENRTLLGVVTFSSIAILLIAIIRGVLMFFMRQTLIVMSRHIEYDQKNAIYQKYQQLSAQFYKVHATGDLMNRITEDVSRVRMYTGPAIMYFINLVALISFCLVNMFQRDITLTLYVLAPLPILAITIYYVNSIINRKSEQIQESLSDLTSHAQQTYSGIRVVKSFVQENAMLNFFKGISMRYQVQAISLAKTEAIYFPSITLMIGLSTLLTIYIGSMHVLDQSVKVGTIVEFVIYINMLTFPVSAIGWTASMIQRAAASQKRINEFLDTNDHQTDEGNIIAPLTGNLVLDHVHFTYKHTGIEALHNVSLQILAGSKVLLLGRAGAGKTTLLQVIARLFETNSGKISIGEHFIESYQLQHYREKISYIPQDVFLFSDTVYNNICFGLPTQDSPEAVEAAAKAASIHNDILNFSDGYQTMIGERGVTLSGGQKQRISIARGLIKQPDLVLIDDCLSAVDAKTEQQITQNLQKALIGKTAIISTHRVFTSIQFDLIVYMEKGAIVELGNHETLLELNGRYAQLIRRQWAEQAEN
ncbi:MAG: ABC transporter ATP-binding protein/permease [Hydrotalea sp.]|nr:ABC transporter ATP-binding protein/permease [Hydrotalea sp.]